MRRVFEGVDELNGVVRDPLRPRRVYVAEKDRASFAPGRVLSVNLDRGAAEPIQAPDTPGSDLVLFPQFLALENNGTRLLVSGSGGLVAIELGVAGAKVVRFPPSTPIPASVSTGPHGLRLLAASRLYAAGGLERVARVASRDAASGIVVLEQPLSPPAALGQSAQLWPGSGQVGAPGGRRAVFLWDSADVGDSADVYLRALPRDSDVGLAVETGVPKQVKGLLEPESEPQVIEAPSAIDFLLDDMDQDQDLDLILAHREGVQIYFQGQRGRFEGDPLIFDSQSFGPGPPRPLATEDLDDDGDRDLVVAQSSGLALWFQDAPGVFDRRLDLGGQFRHSGVVAQDMDGDGDVDLVSQGVGGLLRTFAIYTQLTPGVFDPEPALVEFGGREFALAAADLDTDGDTDLTGVLLTGELVACFQSSPGVFGPPTVIGSTGSGAAVRDLVAADFDGDGDLDLASGGSEGLVAFIQESPGTFASALVTSQNVARIAARDVDGDGRVDLLTRQGLAYLQAAPGEFDPEPRQFMASEIATAFAVADIDADGDADVVTNGAESGVLVQFQTRDRLRRSAPDEFEPLGSLTIADIDADGDLDLLSGYGGPEVFVLLQRSPGEFESTARALDGVVLPDGGGGLLALDLDQDGDLDLVRAALSEFRLFVFLRQNDGTFAPNPITLGSGLPGGTHLLQAVDVNGDGRLDLVQGTNEPGLAVFLQTAPGSFEAEIQLGGPEVTGFPEAVAVADLDGDGDLDIAVGHHDGLDERVAIFHQIAAGEFDPVPLVLQEPEATTSVQALDLDLDGRTDLVLGEIAYYQVGPGEFERVVIPGRLAGDLDGDGDVDVIVPSFPGAALYRNQSPLRIFDGFEEVTTEPFYTFTAAPDFDGDGDLDLVFVGRDDFVNESTNTWGVFLNRSPGFDPEPLVLRAGDPNQFLSLGPVQLVDLDGDGERDLVGTTIQDILVFWGGR